MTDKLRQLRHASEHKLQSGKRLVASESLFFLLEHVNFFT
jgi:hypothetical protein